MKKITLSLGVISSFLVLIGVAIKWMHWPGASVVLVVGCILFSLGYAPMLYINKNKAAATGYQKFVNVVVMIAMILIVIGFLFKIMHWPGAGIGLCTGNFLLLVLIPVLFIHGSKEADPVKKMNFMNEAIIIVLLTSFSFFMWIMGSGCENVNAIARMEQSIAKSDSLLVKSNNLTILTIQKVGSGQIDKVEKARMLSNNMFTYIRFLKNDMLMLTKEFKDTTVLDTFNLKNLKAKACGAIPKKVLFTKTDNDPSKCKAIELKTKLEAYKKALLELVPEKERPGLNLGLNTDSVKTEEGYKQWEHYTLKTKTLIGALTMLSKLQLDVREAEAIVININAAIVMKAQRNEIHKLKNQKDTIN